MAVAPEIRQYFDSVVLVDDKLGNPLKLAKKESDQAVRLFQTLQDDGFVISPVRFRTSKRAKKLDKEIERVVNATKTAKMLVLDWRLDERQSTNLDGDIDNLLKGRATPVGADLSDVASIPAKEIIRKLLELPGAGMKYVVVYTSDTSSGKATPYQLVTHLCTKWKDRSSDDQLVAEARALEKRLSSTKKFDPKPINIGTLFITFIDKKDDPSEVLPKFTERLSQLSGPLSLAFLGAVALMEREAHRALVSFSKPLAVPVFMHIGHNDIEKSQIAPFLVHLLWDYLVDGLGENHLESFLDSLERDRLHNIKRALAFFTASPTEFAAWIQQIKGRGLKYVDHIKWEEALIRLTGYADLDGVRNFLQGEDGVYIAYIQQPLPIEPNQKPEDVSRWAWSQFRMAFEIMLAYIGLKEQDSKPQLDEFVTLCQEETVLFTKLLTTTSATRRVAEFRTGDIYRGTGSNSNTFLLCITPYCDTVFPHKVSHQYKFLVGSKLKWTVTDVKGRGTVSEHISMIPTLENGKFTVVPVQWDFFNTQVWPLRQPPGPLGRWKENDFSPAYLRADPGALRPYVRFENPNVLGALHAYGWDQVKLAEALIPQGTTDQKIASAIQDSTSTEFSVTDRERADEILLGSRIYEFREKYKFTVQLKKEYVQQILNKYLMYHSRAGVPELYYREIPNAFIPLLRPTK